MKKNIVALSLLATCLSAGSHLHAMDLVDQIMEKNPSLKQRIKCMTESEQEQIRFGFYQELKLRAELRDGLRFLDGEQPPLAQHKTGGLLSSVLDDVIFHTNNKKRN